MLSTIKVDIKYILLGKVSERVQSVGRSFQLGSRKQEVIEQRMY